MSDYFIKIFECYDNEDNINIITRNISNIDKLLITDHLSNNKTKQFIYAILTELSLLPPLSKTQLIEFTETLLILFHLKCSSVELLIQIIKESLNINKEESNTDIKFILGINSMSVFKDIENNKIFINFGENHLISGLSALCTIESQCIHIIDLLNKLFYEKEIDYYIELPLNMNEIDENTIYKKIDSYSNTSILPNFDNSLIFNYIKEENFPNVRFHRIDPTRKFLLSMVKMTSREYFLDTIYCKNKSEFGKLLNKQFSKIPDFYVQKIRDFFTEYSSDESKIDALKVDEYISGYASLCLDVYTLSRMFKSYTKICVCHTGSAHTRIQSEFFNYLKFKEIYPYNRPLPLRHHLFNFLKLIDLSL